MKVRGRSGRLAGVMLFAISVIGFFIYAYFLLATEFTIILLQFTVLVVIGALVAVLAWIGYTMATAPKSDQNNNTLP